MILFSVNRRELTDIQQCSPNTLSNSNLKLIGVIQFISSSTEGALFYDLNLFFYALGAVPDPQVVVTTLRME